VWWLNCSSQLLPASDGAGICLLNSGPAIPKLALETEEETERQGTSIQGPLTPHCRQALDTALLASRIQVEIRLLKELCLVKYTGSAKKLVQSQKSESQDQIFDYTDSMAFLTAQTASLMEVETSVSQLEDGGLVGQVSVVRFFLHHVHYWFKLFTLLCIFDTGDIGRMI
jgi:hypothetical protein